jgi:hypothetical protein
MIGGKQSNLKHGIHGVGDPQSTTEEAKVIMVTRL